MYRDLSGHMLAQAPSQKKIDNAVIRYHVLEGFRGYCSFASNKMSLIEYLTMFDVYEYYKQLNINDIDYILEQVALEYGEQSFDSIEEFETYAQSLPPI